MALKDCLLKRYKFGENDQRAVIAPDRESILAAANEYERQGMSASEAAVKAVDDMIASLKADVARFKSEARAEFEKDFPQALTLANQTPAELAEIEAKKKAAEEAKAKADREAAEKEAKDNERKTVQRRMEGANADFQLGQSAEENLSGQRGMFDTILPAKLFPRFEFPAGKADPATAMEDAKRILGINGRFPIQNSALDDGTPARVNTETGVIEFDPKQLDSRSHAAQAAAEEILHAIDLVAPNTTISSTSKRLGIGGDIRAELTNHFNENGEYRNWLDYPFLFRIDLSEDRIKAELFARMGVAYNGDPDLLKLHLPKTYEAFHGLFNLIRESGSSDAYLRRSLPKFDVARIFSGNRQTDGQRLARPGEDTGNAGGRDEGSGLARFYERMADIFGGQPTGRVISDSNLETTTPSDEGVLFSRGQSPQSLDPADAKAAVDVIKSKWKNAPKINVWESFDQAPAGLRDEIERADAQDARGAWFADEIHLFPQNIPNLAVLERTVVHESRHAGLDGVFGRDLNPVLMNLYLKNAELRREVNALQKKTGLNTVNQINEVLADKSLDYAQKLSGWKQVVGKMKEWFEKNGFTRLAAMLDGPTADELVKDVLYQAEEFIRSGKKSTTLTGGAMFSMGTTNRVYNSSREDLSNFNRYDAANDKPSQALRDAIKKFEKEAPGFQIDPLGNSRVIVTRLKKDDLVSSLKTLKEFGDTNNVAVGISSKTANYTDFPESSGFRPYIQRADDEIGGRVSYEHDSNHFARIVGVYVPISLEGEVRFSRARDDDLKSANAAAEYGIAKVTRMALGQKMIKEIVSNPGQFNVINKTLNTQLHKALKNKEFGKVFWAGQQFMEDVSQLASQAAELAPEILPNYGNIKNLGMALRDTVNPLKSRQRNKDIKAAGAAIFDGTMEGGGNPLEGRIFTDKELSDAKLTPEAITFYKQARQVIDKSLDDLSMSEVVRMLGERVKIEPAMMEFLKSNPNQFRAGLLDAIATARENAAPEMVPGWKDIEKRAQETFQHADALKAAGYAPLMRFGKYFVTVRDEGETIYRAHYENRLDLNAAMAELKAKYPRSEVSKGTISEEDFKLMKGMTPETIMLFAEKLGLPMDMQKAAQQYYREAVSARSAMKRRIERKGIAGYSDDLPRVLAGFVTSNARRAAANYNMPIIKGAIDNIDQDAGDIRDEAMEMIEQIESPTEDAAALRGLMYAYFIGGSMASAIVNMTQPLTMTLPYLGQWGNAKASGAIMKAMRPNSKLPQNLKDALKLANEKGITDPQEVYYLYQETIRGISSNRTFQKGMGLWSSMFSIAENLNRRTTFLAAYDMWDSADEKTRAEMTKTTGAKDGFAFAQRTVQETQGIYNKGNRPNWARGAIGATVFTFKQYSIAYLELVSRLPMQQKMIMLSMLVLLAGLGGLPGEEDAEDLIDTIGQAMGYNTNSKMFIRQKVADLIGETFMPIVMQGVSGMPGFPADIGGRLGMANILPGTSLFQRSESNSTDKEIAEAIGPIAGIVKNFNNAKKAAESGEWFDAMASAAPNAIGNALKGAKIGQTGEMTDYKDRKTVDGLDMSHAFFKFIGFNPKPVADEGRISRMIGQDVRLLKDVEADIADKLARAIKNGDDEKQERALAELDEWNEKNPDTPIVITRQQINRRIEEMQTSRDIRQMRTIPKESRAYYMENVK